MKSLVSVYSLHFTYVSETDTMLGGVSAFPGSSIVTGLKYKKYKGYIYNWITMEQVFLIVWEHLHKSISPSFVTSSFMPVSTMKRTYLISYVLFLHMGIVIYNISNADGVLLYSLEIKI
jgi:hypothetical protein